MYQDTISSGIADSRLTSQVSIFHPFSLGSYDFARIVVTGGKPSFVFMIEHFNSKTVQCTHVHMGPGAKHIRFSVYYPVIANGTS